jgi:protein-export membrane protein SecD
MRLLLIAACLASLGGCGRHEPVGVLLVYEVDNDAGGAARRVPLEREVLAIRKRVRGLADAEAGEDGRIVVRVYGDDATRVRQRLDQTGALEFRIVADRRDERHRDVIALAEKRNAKAKDDDAPQPVVLAEGRPAAKWVRVVKSEAAYFADQPAFLTRPGPDESLEILVVIDPQHVTGDYLSSVSPGLDRAGKPCVNFLFDAAGARRFGKLTGGNLPDLARGEPKCLAIILDGQVSSAPAIRSRIDDRGEITGAFSEQEAQDLAAVLAAGSLPAPLRLVEERPATPPD